MIFRGKTGIIATGRLTKDPEIKTVGQKQSRLAKFGVAVGEGDNKEFVNAVCWRNHADYAECLKKGDEVFIVGIEKTREYEGRDGETKTATDTEIKFIMKQPTGIASGDARDDGLGDSSFHMGKEVEDVKMPWD
jgi:single-stranded DNA-binding protein